MYIPTPGGGESLSGQSIAFAVELLHAAEKYEGKPFVNHAATALCGSNMKTFPVCMEIGLGPEGYDCSGLVIRALSDVLGRSDTDWADGIRHVKQMSKVGSKVGLAPVTHNNDHALGLLFVYDHIARGLVIPSAHIGLYAGNNQLLHARSRGTDRVAKGTVKAAGTSKRFAYAIDPMSLAIN